jgi:polar amino acid transport system permease protein
VADTATKESALPGALSLSRRADGLSLAAVLFAAFCVLMAWLATGVVEAALIHLERMGDGWWVIFALALIVVAFLFWPAGQAVLLSRRAGEALARGDIVEARIDTANAKDWAYLTFGWGAAALMATGAAAFVMANDASVGRTFFFLPLIIEKWPLVAKAFGGNIFIFVTAEILVLVWGLIVAMARLIPGPAGKPVRMLAIIYCDVFRGLPAIVTLYLVGFGIPLSGVIPAQIPGIGKVPLTWFCILALTLTYGAYVAEVYRAGIDSIHRSQWAAARSLGLSYTQTLRHVVVPQAVRRIVAPLLNDFIGLQKDTALVQVIGVIDAFNQSRMIASNAFNLSAVTIVAILFVLITIPQARFVDRLVERDQARMRAAS